MPGGQPRRSPARRLDSSIARGTFAAGPGAYAVNRVVGGASAVQVIESSPIIPGHDEDFFGRADAMTLGDTETRGLTWTVEDAGLDLPPVFGVEDGQARNYAGQVFPSIQLSAGYAWVDEGASDGTVRMQIADNGVTQDQGSVTFRYVDTDNHWMLSVDLFNGRCNLARIIGGIASVVASSATGLPVTAGSEFAAEFVGDQIRALCNGTEVIAPQTSSAHQTATKVGFFLNWPQWIDGWSWDSA